MSNIYGQYWRLHIDVSTEGYLDENDIREAAYKLFRESDELDASHVDVERDD